MLWLQINEEEEGEDEIERNWGEEEKEIERKGGEDE
jgi:hypothetical protein